VRKTADPSAPLGAPLRRVTPRDVALATLALRVQELEDKSQTYRLSRRIPKSLTGRLIAKGLLKKLPSLISNYDTLPAERECYRVSYKNVIKIGRLILS